MTTTGKDTLGTRDTLNVGGKAYAYYSLKKAAAKLGDVSRLPFSMKVLLENLLRFEDGGFTVSTGRRAGAGRLAEEPDRKLRMKSNIAPRACCCRISPACLAWSIWPRCAMRLPSWAAIRRRSTRWCPSTSSSTTQ